MSKRSTILKIAGLDPKEKRTHICNAAIMCEYSLDCKHGHLHNPNSEERSVPNYCSEFWSFYGKGVIVRCVKV